MRTYKISKTRQGKTKITLYEKGIKVLERPMHGFPVARLFGEAWASS